MLAHRFPHVPNLGDITTIDWSTVEPVDIIAGGTPCQDLSTAGRRAGMTDGTRSNLWVQMREAIAHVQPSFVVWENVRGALSAPASSALEHCPGCMGDPRHGGPILRALGRVLGDLADLGFDAEVRGLRAADVGACHGRFRVFLLAWRREASADAHIAGLQGQPDQAGAAQAGRHGHPVAGAGRPDLTILPTPRSSDTNGAGTHGAGGVDLRTAVQLLPTPRATDGSKGGPNQRGSKGDLMLPSAVHRLLPTPTSNLGDNGGPQDPAKRRAGGHSVSIEDAVHGLSLLPTPRVENNENRQSERYGGARGNFHGLLTGAVSWGEYAAAIARHEQALGRPAPDPTEPGPKGNPRLSARFVEFMMMLPAGWITDVPGVTRNEALRACGNGVVPQQAITALQMMRHRAESLGVTA